MKMVEIKGIISPIVTPMNEDESIKEQELRNQVNRQIEAGIHGLFTSGTNGEGYILNEEEKETILKIVIEETAGRVPVHAGTGGIGTKDTIRQSRMAQKLGADVLSIITPWFASASQNELYQHFKTVAEAVDMPIVLYNIPARTGISLLPDTVAKLSKIENIVGVKDSSGNFDNMLQYIEKTRDDENFAVISGNDSLILWNLMAGGKGAVSGCANVYPKVMSSIYDKYLEGNHQGAREAQDSIRSFRNCFKYGNPNTIVKTAVLLLGYPVGKCRAPFNQITSEGIKALEEVLATNKKQGMF